MHNLNNRLIPYSERCVIVGEAIVRSEISIVIPVKNDQGGVNSFLESFFQTHKSPDYPLEVIIVDNNSFPPICIPHHFLDKGLPIHLCHCKKKGAAAARNLGVEKASGTWILFTDSDCVATKSFIAGYLGLDAGKIAYAGHVVPLRDTLLDRYYDSQKTLIPPKATYGDLVGIPMYIVTANAIVYKVAYQQTGGFNEDFPSAGGEDEDFSMRLWESGVLGYAPHSLIRHNFKNGFQGFANRFINYGQGASIVEKKWKIRKQPKWKPPHRRTFFNYVAAYLQFLFMQYGYWVQRRKIDVHKY